ncbi:NADPH-dependent ferric siderophore reductase [Volucribacter psittacicida]|uniref:NADPH-dependent ferric siderophore reductase n=1 Tax=Volucribacter psittacicida TaxID=203482 RepID=A0A4R1G5P1_9PAST|nr:siderophore-interacting protein [Volucribacter psittacicida]TCK01893.1 NADPH-dependent ferric siderophore reductase [Volucribacter psittacicida]
MTERTAINDINRKLDIIEHVNDDHYKELLAIAQVFIDPKVEKAFFTDLFEQGMELEVSLEGQTQIHFVPFLTEGEIELKVRQIAIAALRQLDNSMTSQHYYFQVQDSQSLSANFMRLWLKPLQPLTRVEAGLAWVFTLNRFSQQPDEQQLIGQAKRYYSLRQREIRNIAGQSMEIVAVDIYLHNDSLGSNWAKALQTGDILHASSLHYEKTAHLNTGQAVLFGDETAFPTLAKILEDWQNPQPPIVISIAHQDSEQEYLKDYFPTDTQVYYLNQQNLTEQLINIMQQLPRIDNVWGATEQKTAKALRQYFREIRYLNTENSKVKAYWVKR